MACTTRNTCRSVALPCVVLSLCASLSNVAAAFAEPSCNDEVAMLQKSLTLHASSPRALLATRSKEGGPDPAQDPLFLTLLASIGGFRDQLNRVDGFVDNLATEMRSTADGLMTAVQTPPRLAANEATTATRQSEVMLSLLKNSDVPLQQVTERLSQLASTMEVVLAIDAYGFIRGNLSSYPVEEVRSMAKSIASVLTNVTNSLHSLKGRLETEGANANAAVTTMIEERAKSVVELVQSVNDTASWFQVGYTGVTNQAVGGIQEYGHVLASDLNKANITSGVQGLKDIAQHTGSTLAAALSDFAGTFASALQTAAPGVNLKGISVPAPL